MDKNRLDIPVEGLQYVAYTIREVLLNEAMCLTRLSDIDNDARDVGELLHHGTPLLFVLLNFLFVVVVNTQDA